ncbi:MAG: hypothetical protein ABH840_02695 [Nanoarchaeota archaeon]
MDFVNRSGNLADIKTRIVSFIKIKGPVLPIHIFKETKTTLLLSSAFLSDLVSEKTLKISDLKVGGSPLYFLPGQETMLENFHKYLPGKEQEAFQLLKDKKVLKDDEQEPAIRVALRNIKDFAMPFSVKLQDKQLIFWQYFSLSEEDARKIISEMLEKYQPKPEEKPLEKIEEKKPAIPVSTPAPEEPKKKIEPSITTEKSEEKIIEPIFETKPEIKKKPKRQKQPPFIEQIKSFLASKNIEFLGIEKSAKKEIFLKIRKEGKETLLLALDKKKVDESDILKAYKKSQALNLPYIILARGETSKKLKESIEAHKTLGDIERLE